jgi:hypothetical protein
MVYFHTKNLSLGKYWRALQRLENVDKFYGQMGIFYIHLVYFTTIWYILCLFGTFFPFFGIMYQEKSGTPELQPTPPLTPGRKFSQTFQQV